MQVDALQREYLLRAMFNALRYVVRAGCPWRMMPNDMPLWEALYQQARRWFGTGEFEQVRHELRVIVPIMEDRGIQPTAAIFDARTV